MGVYIIHSRVSESTFMLQLEGKKPYTSKEIERFIEGADKPSEEIAVDDFLNVPTDLILQNEYNILSRKIGQTDLGDTDGQRIDAETVGNIERFDSVNDPLNKPVILDRCAKVKNIAQQDLDMNAIDNGKLINDTQVSRENGGSDSIEATGHLINRNVDPLLEGSTDGNETGAKVCSAVKIIASKSTKKGTYFRVRWSNLDKDSDTWEPFENVSVDPILLENFTKMNC